MNKKPELSPFVKRIAEHYNFKIEYSELMERWEVRGGYHHDIIWASDRDEDKFLDELAECFKEWGYEENCCYSG